QANGAVASFYSVQPMPARSGGDPTIVVKTPVPPNTFVAGLAITVVARAAEVWITTLEAEMDPEVLTSLASHPGSDPPTAAWKRNNSDQALYLPPQQPQSVPQSEAAPQSLSSETPIPAVLTRHGTWWDRRKDERLDVVMGGRFTRLFPYLPTASFKQSDLEELACVVIAPAEPEQEDQA